MIRILYIIHGLDVGRMEKHLLEVCLNLDEKRFCPFVFCLSPGGRLQEDFKVAGVEVKIPPHVALFKKGWFRYLFWLIREIRKRKIDVLHIYIGYTHITEVIASKFSGVRKIITTRRGRVNEMKGLHLILQRITNIFIDKIVCNSRFILIWASQREKFNKNKGIIIYNGVPEGANVSDGLSEGEQLISKKIIYIASLRRYKRHIDLLKASKKILTYNKDVCFIFVGDGEERPKIEKYIKDHDLSNNVFLLGYRSDVSNLLSQSIISINYSETECNSNAILESMAAGVPVIASRIEGNLELIKHGVDGLLVSAKDPEELADAINYLLSNPKRADEIGKVSKLKIKEMFSLRKMIDKMEQLYITLL